MAHEDMKTRSVSLITRGMGPKPGDVSFRPGGRLLSNSRKRVLARRERGCPLVHRWRT